MDKVNEQNSLLTTENRSKESKTGEKGLPGRRNPLSVRERNFVKFYTDVALEEEYGNAIKSAIKAGFSEKNVEHSVRRLMKNPLVNAAINEVHRLRQQDSPDVRNRVMSNFDHDEIVARKTNNLVALNKINEMRGKYMDMWSATNVDASAEKDAERLARMTAEKKEICSLIARIRTSKGDNSKVEARLKQCLLDNPSITFEGETQGLTRI